MDGKWVTRALVLTLGSALLCAGLSRPGSLLSFGGVPSATPVAVSLPPKELTEDNLVDGLSSVDLPVRIAKADLNSSILSIDLKVTEDQFDKEQLYLSMADVIAFTFERTSNIDQLLLRFVAEDQWLGTRYLLLAADVRRGEWPAAALEELRNAGGQELSPMLIKWFRITLTHLWKEHIPY